MIEQFVIDLDKAFQDKNHNKIKQIIISAESQLMSQGDYRSVTRLYEEVRLRYTKQGEYEHLMHYSMRYLQYIERIGMEETNHTYYSIKCHVEYLLDNHTMSLQYIEKAITMVSEERHKKPLVGYLNIKAHLLCLIGEVDVAYATLQECYSWVDKLELEKTQIHTETLLVGLQVLLAMEGKEGPAVGLLHMIKANPKLHDYPTAWKEAFLLEGRLNEAIGEKERALNFYRKSLEVAEKNHLWYDVKRLYKLIADSLNTLGRFEESSAYLYRFIELNDELEKVNKNALKKKLEVQMELEAVISEAGKLRELNEKFRRQRDFDFLTGIYSRRYSHKYVETLLDHFHSSGEKFSILTFDIDDFKTINDNHGHLIGDKAICEVVHMVQNSLKGDYTFGRLGGDEFIVIFEKRTCDEVLPMVQRLVEEIRQTVFMLGNERLSITISAGLIDSDHSIHDIEAMLHLADMYMYEAKNDGRSRVYTTEHISSEKE